MKLRDRVLKLSDRITSGHEKFFSYLSKKSKTSVWFTILLLFMALYEVAEHFIIPILLIWWGIK